MLDYDLLLKKIKRNEVDPFTFLSNLSSFQKDQPDFGLSSFMGGRSARENQIFTPEDIVDEVNICDIVRNAVNDKRIVLKDLKIDDSGLPQAKNFYEWISKDQFAGTVFKPYIEQLITGVILFAEYCDRCSDTEWLLHTHKVDDTFAKFERKVCLFEYGKCPGCGTTRSKRINKEKINFYRELALRVGQRGGKSVSVGGMYAPYITHRILKMQKPNEIYGLPSSNVLHGTFVALTYKQAKDTLWDPYYGTLLESKFFSEYHAMLRHYEERYGETLFKFNDTFVQYRHRALTCLTGDTLIDTDKGLLPIKQDLTGFLVKGINGKYSEVTDWFYSGKKEVRKITTEYGYSIKASEEHPILVLTKNLDIVWRKVKNLKVGDYIATNVDENSAFPEKLQLKYDPIHGNTFNSQLLQWISTQKTFTITDAQTRFPNRPSIHAKLSKLATNGFLEKTRLKRNKKIAKRLGYSTTEKLPYYRYKKTDKFSMALRTTINGTVTLNEEVYHTRYFVTIPTKMTTELAYIIGYMVSEGWYAKDWGFGNSDLRVINHFKDCFLRSFGIIKFKKSTVTKTKARWKRNNKKRKTSIGFKSTKPYYQCRIENDDVKGFLRYAGLDYGYSKDRVIPWSILQAPEDCVIAFLSSLFEGDGYVRSIGGGVCYTSTSRTLLKQIQILLLRFGIMSKLLRKSLCLDALSSDLFMKKIGFVTKHDRITVTRKRQNSISYKLPYIKECAGGLKPKGKGSKVAKVWHYPSAKHGNPMLEPIKFQKPEIYDKVQKLLGYNIVWKRITSIKELGKRDTYDITVNSKSHAFTADGIITHNCYPAGPDKRVLRGRTRCISAIDEIAYFDFNNADKVKISAKEVYIALERSLLTVRAAAEKLIRAGYDEALSGYFMNVSSPVSARDMICELTRNAVGSTKIYGKVLPTWKMNPNITREDLAEEFKKDPVAAMRDYGAEPPLNGSPFIGSPDMLVQAKEGERRNGIQIKHYQRKYNDGTAKRYAKITKLRQCTIPSILSIDAGVSLNSFACVVGYNTDEGAKIHCMVEVQPAPGVPLNFTLIYEEIISPIIKQCNVKIVLADRWNSIKLLSDAEHEFGIVSKQYSLKYVDMCDVRYMFEQTTIGIPEIEKGKTIEDILNYPPDEYPKCFEYRPAEHFVVQALTVQNTGSSVIKGDGNLTDDIWRAFCLNIWGLTQQEFAEILDAAPETKSVQKLMGVSKHGSGGGKSIGSGIGKSSRGVGIFRPGR